MRVALLMGGDSTEREVSLVSGEQIYKALLENGHEVIKIDPTATKTEQTALNQTDRQWIGIDYPDIETLPLHRGSLYAKNILIIKRLKVDVVFIGLHGGKGENGVVQGMLDAAEILYTGSGRIASMLAMEKDISRTIFKSCRLPVAKGLVVDKNKYTRIENFRTIKLPVVVKPNNQGSTIGLHVVDNMDTLHGAIEDSFQYSSRTIIEEYIPGREITVTVLGEKAYPIVEIIPNHGLYDYECKYSSGMSQYVVPAELDQNLTEKIQELGLRAHQVLSCQGYSRVDMRLSPDNKPFILEVNTLPGMTGTSLVPKAARAVGIDFNQLIEMILDEAINRKRNNVR